ncbi:MAG TPA: proton-conducting transporter membrane subunit, partial [Planctomycetota bacterium]|nr:proton-conducting transporter membrane subunit [Planctomycetota bacterium]
KASCALLLVLELGVVGVLVSLDLFLWFVFWQLSALAIGLHPVVHGARRGVAMAAKFALHASAGSALMLVAIVALRLDSGTFSIPALAELARERKLGGEHLPGGGALLGMAFSTWCAWFLFLGCALRMPLVPLHAFFTGALKEAPAPFALLQGGVVRALGAFALLRLCFPLLPSPVRDHAFLLGCVGVATIVHGAFTSLRQRDWNGVFACNALGQMGWMLLGVAASTQQSLQGAALQMFTAAAASAALFLAGSLLRGREFEDQGGLRRSAPRTFALATLAVLAGIGVPGFALFASQTQIFVGACDASDARFRWLAVVAAVGWLIHAASSLWAWQRVFFSAPKLGSREIADATPRETCLVALLLAVSLAAGILPRSLEAPLRPSAVHLLELIRGAP